MDIVLNSEKDEPIYVQLYNQISSQIISGKLKIGEKLPAIRQISNELKISVIPVKMAWEELDKNGFIKTVIGSGTFVNEIPKIEINQKLQKKSELLAKKICNEAKEIGLSKETLIELIEKNFNS